VSPRLAANGLNGCVDISKAHLLLDAQSSCFNAFGYNKGRHLMLDGELLYRNASSVLSIEAETGEVVQNEFVT